MPLDGRSGLTCMRISMRAMLPGGPSPLLHPDAASRFLLVRVWVGLCRGLMWGKPLGLANGAGPVS